jgi:hypothetical protein
MDRPRVYIRSNAAPTRETTLDFRNKQPSEEDHKKRMRREKIPCKIETVFRVGDFYTDRKLSRAKKARLQALEPFFGTDRMERVVLPIIGVNSRISMRALDWLVINYSKKHHITLVKSSMIIGVYNDYRSCLRYWRRPLFDAFRRGARIYYDHGGHTYSTTVAQLNFLFWCEKNGILDYASRHLSDIEADQIARVSECRKEKARLIKLGHKRKRCELSKSSPVNCQVYNVPVTVHFGYNKV